MVEKNGFGKLILISFILSLIMGFGGVIMPGTASAASDSVTITGNGLVSTTPTTFTLAQLEGMAQVQARYSSINTWPTKKWYVGKGVLLADLLTAAGGIKPEAKMIKVTSTDGYKMSFTVQELLNDPRYYYPGLKANDEYKGEIAGSPADAVQIAPMLALQSANSDNFANMNTAEALLLLLGQRWVTEQTNQMFVKYVTNIEVTTDTPAQWAAPIASVPSGTIAAGTGVALTNESNDADKIYYTTDGSDPTYESPIYNWIASRWWSSRAADLATVNHPIVVNQSLTIKAKTIGFGKTDSEIVTYNYQVVNKGDIDNNGLVNILDVVKAINFIKHTATPTTAQMNAADMDNNGTINVLDLVKIINKVRGLS
ncbi:hypothetical protein JT05_10175 [Desulfosporosinus sp. Tol-M]|nr:hypothetical protein JT05_10175 [Desulfosporosinus sp. Tol-M]